MRTFRDAIKEVKVSFNKLIIFDVFLNSVIIFLAIYLLLSVFNMFFIYAMIPALIYFIYTTNKRTRVNKIQKVETAYPEMDEKLRTAVDNQDDHNIMVNELQAEILRDLRNVEEATFFNEKRVYSKSAIILALCFVIIFISPIGLNLFGLNIKVPPVFDDFPLNPLSDEGGPQQGTSSLGGPESTGLIPTGANIYGEESVARIEGKSLSLRIKPSGSEINIRQQGEIEEREFEEAYPNEVYASSSETFKEELPSDLEEQQIIKNYFKGLAEG